MKISVSVPDDLWNRACRRMGDPSPSAVIQAALTQFVGNSAQSQYAVRPPLDEALAAEVEAARMQIVESARQMYQSGYREGIELARSLSFSQMDYIVREGALKAAQTMAKFATEIAMEIADTPPGARPLIEPTILLPFLGSYADSSDGRVEWTPIPPTIEGIDRALADVWEQVNRPVESGGAPQEAKA